MTGSRWVDIAIVLVALIAATSGWRQGAVASALAFVGVILGAVAGILLAPHLLVHVTEGKLRILAGISLIVVLVIIGEVAGMVLGRAARSGMHSPTARSVDSVIGAGLQAVAVVVAAWLLAIPLTSSSQPNIAAAVRGSDVLASVDEVAPQWLRRIPTEFSALLDTSGLPDVIGPFRAHAHHRGRSTRRERSRQSVGGAVASECSPHQRRSTELPARARGIRIHRRPRTRHDQRPRGCRNREHHRGTPWRAHCPRRWFSSTPPWTSRFWRFPDWTRPVLPFAPEQARTGDNALVLGYPGGGPYTASAARVREVLNLNGPDIYKAGTTQREVYTVRGSIRQGNSGGPMVDDQGRVLGVVFGAAVDDSDTGFVLTAQEVSRQLNAAASASTPVPTGACIL